MRLASVRLKHIGPFEDTTLRLTEPAASSPRARGAHEDDDASDPPSDASPTSTPRPMTVLFGADGIGKTTVLASLATTRPGYAIPPTPTLRPGASSHEPASIVAEWLLGEDDPERPHPLVVASPSAVLEGESPDGAAARRREQALFDRRAQNEGGFVFVGFSGARWFSRATSHISVPERSILKYDVRQVTSFDDPTRADLTRETKQVLAYAGIARALAAERAEYIHLTRFDRQLREVVDVMLEPFGFAYAGVSPTSLEPQARDGRGRLVPFDALPRSARHLVAFGALSMRALFAAYPNEPRDREGVVAIDDIESQQDPAMLRAILPLLQRALPNVQWIVTTASTQLANACAPGEVIALRRLDARIEVGEDALH